MIDPKELRIGNFVSEPECEPYYFPVEIIGRYYVAYRNESIKTLQPEPIPLTEEWLVKFGFEWDLKYCT